MLLRILFLGHSFYHDLRILIVIGNMGRVQEAVDSGTVLLADQPLGSTLTENLSGEENHVRFHLNNLAKIKARVYCSLK